MPNTPNALSRLPYPELNQLLERSAILRGYEAEAFARALKDVGLYISESRLQITHSRALLDRINSSKSFEEALILSNIQESMPCFAGSLTLKHIFAQGLLVCVELNPKNTVFRRAASRLCQVPGFASCPVLQGYAAKLFSEAIRTSDCTKQTHELVKQLKMLPGLSYSTELQSMVAEAEKMARRQGRDPIVKIDLNQKLLAPVRAVKKLFGMEDFRVRVELKGVEQYDQAVVRIPALSEKAALKKANEFIASFLKGQLGEPDRSAKIVDVFPPGSSWESGLHPVLQL